MDVSILACGAVMRLSIPVIGVALALLGATAPTGAQTAAPSGRAALHATLDTTRLDALLRDSLGTIDDARPGYALIVMHRGEVIFARSAGRITPATVMPIASASKWLAGAVIMSLVDDGLLALDDTLGRFMLGLEPLQSGITVRQLFSHTSGLPPQSPCLSSAGGSLAGCATEILARGRRGSAPGRRFQYGGSSMQVAARIAEIAGGASWDELFRRRIAIPLGMEHTTFSPRGGSNPRIAGGAHSSAEEYAKFLAMIAAGGSVNGQRILSPGSVRDMLADQTRGAAMRGDPVRNARVDDAARPRVRYGMGVWRETFRLAGEEAVEHASPGALGFVPWFDPRHELVGVFATVRPLDEVMPTVLQLRRLVRESASAR